MTYVPNFVSFIFLFWMTQTFVCLIVSEIFKENGLKKLMVTIQSTLYSLNFALIILSKDT